ncbi:MAG: methionine gamma-lyase family protein [Clostridia bacterium]|nr:methionine gamma-lyase family protein [Clostridia bacterium]
MFDISQKIISLSQECESEISPIFKYIDDIAQKNQAKVLSAFVNNRVGENCLSGTTGYGYSDVGRETLEKVYADVFHAENTLVRHNIVNGTHALTIALFGVLRPGDTLFSATGKPYDTLDEVIHGDGNGSLRDFGISYRHAELASGHIDKNAIVNTLTPDIKAVILQRSRGYDWRPSISVEEIGEVIALIKNIRSDIICIVDNCYGEFTQTIEPTDVGADLCIGSLIKNCGGSLAQSGGYIAGTNYAVELAAQRQTTPGIGKECGATLNQNRLMYQGFFMAPHIVAQAMKSAVFCGALMQKLGYEVNPRPNDIRNDIVQAIKFDDKDKMIRFCQSIQKASPIDSYAVPTPWDMPGYNHQVIMAAGTFVSGASIELSADAPIKEPYVLYVQGGITYESAKIAIMYAAESIECIV